MPEMHVLHHGAEQAPPLLLIHGSGFAGSSWDRMIPALAARHHVIRIDLPGCGRSPAEESPDVPARADRVAALLRGLGLAAVAVAGHSAGGYVATALAERHPALVRSLALISTGPSQGAFRRQPFVLRALLAPPLGPVLWARRSDAMLRRAISATAARPVDIPDALVAELRSTTYRGYRTAQQQNRAYISELSVPERLAAPRVPVLVVFGGADPRWEPSSAHEYDAVPGAVVETLPGVGHLPLLEAPEATSSLVDVWGKRH